MNGQPFKIYSITFVASGVNLGLFENFLRYDPVILGFWNYIPLVYLVKTNVATAAELSVLVRNQLMGNHCLVAEINPSNVDGWLPKPAWEWFRSPPEKSSSLGDTFGRLPSTTPQQGRLWGGIFGPRPDLPRK